MTDQDARLQEDRPLDAYSIRFADELRLLRLMVEYSGAQQRAGLARDIELLERTTAARDSAMRAIQDLEAEMASGRAALVREMEVGRTSPAGLRALAQHREAQTLIAQLAQQDEETKRVLNELLNEARVGTQAAEAGEVTLAAYRRVVAPSLDSAELVDQRG